jgi:hypothetical protein
MKGNLKINRKGKAKMDQSKDMIGAAQQGSKYLEISWQKPPLGWGKCNVDASFVNEEKSDSWGVVIRDQSRNILCSAWDMITHCQTAAMGEAIACLEGLKMALVNSNANIIVETDCASILKAFKDGRYDRSKVCHCEGISLAETYGSKNYCL